MALQHAFVRPTTKKRRDRIISEVIDPANKLIAAMGDWDLNGIHSDFIFPYQGPDASSIVTLREQLIRYRDLAENVADWLDKTKGPKRRDESEVRQFMITLLLQVYLYFSPNPSIGRTVSWAKDAGHPKGKKSYEDGAFSAFAKNCGKIILGVDLPLDSYIKEAVRKHKANSL